MKHIPTLSHATERDIDLLIIEELITSASFGAWFMQQMGNDAHNFGSATVFHSLRRTSNRREIDITLEMTTGGARHLYLIENKLDAQEQPDQAASYREEADERHDNYSTVTCVLLCPEGYLALHPSFASQFDKVLNYEAIRDYFKNRSVQEQGEVGLRCAYRARLMTQAIQKQRRGYEQVVHPAKHAFSKRYNQLLTELAPGLMPGPSMLRESAAGSRTMIFAPESLPNWSFLPQTRIVHQLRKGNANINFYGWGEYFDQLQGVITDDIAGTGFRLIRGVNRRANGRAGLVIAVETPKVDLLGEFDSQEEAIREGIKATRQLREWFLTNQNTVSGWAEVVGNS